MSDDPLDPAARIIEKLGGTRAAARMLGLAPSTIQSWKTGGLIPARHQKLVLDRARQHDIALSASEFIAQTPHEAQANLAALSTA